MQEKPQAAQARSNSPDQKTLQDQIEQLCGSDTLLILPKTNNFSQPEKQGWSSRHFLLGVNIYIYSYICIYSYYMYIYIVIHIYILLGLLYSTTYIYIIILYYI